MAFDPHDSAQQLMMAMISALASLSGWSMRAALAARKASKKKYMIDDGNGGKRVGQYEYLQAMETAIRNQGTMIAMHSTKFIVLEEGLSEVSKELGKLNETMLRHVIKKERHPSSLD